MSKKTSEVVKHNMNEIRKFLEFTAAYIGPGAPPNEPLGKKARGSSRPPATEAAMDFWHENSDAARILNPMIRELSTQNHAWKGIYFSTLLTLLYADPTVIPRWENRETEEDRNHISAFFKMCRLLADAVKAKYGANRQINVTIPKKNEPAKDWQTGHNRDNNDNRSSRSRALAIAIRSRYKSLQEETDWTDSQIRTRLQRDFGAYSTGDTDLLSRSTVNLALKEDDVA